MSVAAGLRHPEGVTYTGDYIAGVWRDTGEVIVLPRWTKVADRLYFGGMPVDGIPEGTGAVINCSTKQWFEPYPGVVYVQCPFRDDEDAAPDEDVVAGLVDVAEALYRRGLVVYIHCRLGLNRSALVAGLLLRRLGLGHEETLAALTARSEHVLANRSFRRLLLWAGDTA